MRSPRPRHSFVALLLYLPLAAAMFGPWPGFVENVSAHCSGAPALDMRGHWTAADARALVAACGAGGRRAYLHLELADLVYPAAVGAVLVLVTALLLRNHRGWIWPAAAPAIAMTVLDYAENAGIWILLLRWPSVPAAVADTAGVATAIKHVLGFVAFSVPLLLGATLVAHRIWRSATRHRRAADSRPWPRRKSAWIQHRSRPAGGDAQ